jgi:ketosteroid isomerase-like protein
MAKYLKGVLIMADLSQEEVMDFLKRWRDAYDSSDDIWWDFFSKDASFFTVSSPTRIDGLDAFRHGFEPNFKGHTRHSQLLSPDIKVAGNTAVCSLHTRTLIDGRAHNLQTSLTVVRDDQGKLQIRILHNSQMSVPALPTNLIGLGTHSFEDISLLEERVATAAAAVGTPK